MYDNTKYYEVFEDRYAGYPDTIKNMIDNTNLEDWLDVLTLSYNDVPCHHQDR